MEDNIVVIQEAFTKFAKFQILSLENKMEYLYGGPKVWKNNHIAPTEEAHDFAVEIWNEAVDACMNICKDSRRAI